MAVVFALETKHRAILLIVHVVLSEDFLLFFIRKGILETVGRLMPDVTTVVAADTLHVLWIDPCCHLLGLYSIPVSPVLLVRKVCKHFKISIRICYYSTF